MDPSERIDWGGVTHVGRHRTSNQDAYVGVPARDTASYQKRGHLFVVADGMGAHAAGELASKMTVDVIPLSYQKYAKVGPGDALRLAVQNANENVHNWGQENVDFAGMGTTVTALAMLPDRFYLAHVGDSRIYRVRPNSIEQLSRDHSLVQELIERGRLRPDQVESFGASNVIVRSVGPDADVKVDVAGPGELLPGDTFVLCSDGLTRHVSDAEIGWIVNRRDAQRAAQVLVEAANARGGLDNITAVVVRYRGPVAAPTVTEDKPPQKLEVWPHAKRLSRRVQRESIVLASICALYVLVALPLHLPATGPILVAGVAAGFLWAGIRIRDQVASGKGDTPPSSASQFAATALDLDAEGVRALGTAAAAGLQWKQSRSASFDSEPFLRQKEHGDELVDAGQLDQALDAYCDVLECKVQDEAASDATTVTMEEGDFPPESPTEQRPPTPPPGDTPEPQPPAKDQDTVG